MMDGDGVGGMGGMGGMKMKPTVLTKITFNGGGTWQNIKAPSTFSHQKCNRCGGAKDCSLHLHGEPLGQPGYVCLKVILQNEAPHSS